MIIFRCNAGPQVGLGHLMRCRTLALKLKEKSMSCIMVGPDASHANLVDTNIFEDWVSVPDWVSSAADCERLIEIAKHYHAGCLVLDDYRVDENYQLNLHDAGLKWLQFDGAACQPLWANLILNTNPAVQPSDYTGLVRNPDARLLLGPT